MLVGESVRAYDGARGTTWLKYITFTYRPILPDHLERFLADAFNREEVIASFARAPEQWRLAVKVDLPAPGTWAYLLDDEQARWLDSTRRILVDALRDISPLDSIAELARWRASAPPSPVAHLLVDRIEEFLSGARYESHVCQLQVA